MVAGPAGRHVLMLQLTVEAPCSSLRLIRVSGPMDQDGAPSLLRLVDAQLALVAARRSAATDLLVDVSGVSSFEPRALGTMRHVRYSAQLRGVRVHLSGWSGRSHLLPVRVHRVLIEFSSFPTTEIAVAALARAHRGSLLSSESPEGPQEHPTDGPSGGHGGGEPTVLIPPSTRSPADVIHASSDVRDLRPERSEAPPADSTPPVLSSSELPHPAVHLAVGHEESGAGAPDPAVAHIARGRPGPGVLASVQSGTGATGARRGDQC